MTWTSRQGHPASARGCLSAVSPAPPKTVGMFMAKTLEVISDAIRNTKHPFRQVEDRPGKPKKHRYERRKVREYIRLGDWVRETT